MPFYIVNGLRVHIKMARSKTAPAPCAALVVRDGALVRCCGISGFLCDWPVGDARTCDAPLCDAHAHEVTRNRHYCPRHLAEHLAEQRAATPGLFDFEALR